MPAVVEGAGSDFEQDIAGNIRLLLQRILASLPSDDSLHVHIIAAEVEEEFALELAEALRCTGLNVALCPRGRPSVIN